MKLKTKDIEQTVSFKATPHEVYEMLMDSKKHAAFTGGEALISRKEGGEIHAFDGYVNGKNIMLVPDKKIVQEWRSAEIGWPEDHFSIVTFTLTKSATGTKLVFKQTAVPAVCYKNISAGWKEYYWEPMQKMIAKLAKKKK